MSQTHTSVNARAREVYRYAHVNMRLRDRYGFEIDMDEYRRICEQFKQKQFQEPRFLTTGEVEAWVEVKGQPVCVLYKPREGLVATVLPCPPGYKEIFSKRKKDLEEEASRQEVAIEQERDPVTMRKEMLKKAALRTKALIEQRKQEEILNLFMEISKMKLNAYLRNHSKDWRHPSSVKTG